MKHIVLIVFMLICIIGMLRLANADKEIAPRPYVSVSPSGRFYFKLVPDGDLMDGGKGYLYMVGRDKDELLYTTRGWYARKAIISADGRYIARIGYSGRTQGSRVIPPDKHIAIGFYEKGKLLKEYTVTELVPDPKKLSYSKSHYDFFKGEPYYYTRFLTKQEQQESGIRDSHGFWVVADTVDGKRFVFDMRTGIMCNSKLINEVSKESRS